MTLGLVIIISDNQRCKELHKIISIDELSEVTSAFDGINIESCDCTWKAEVVFMGGVLESQISGKVVLQEDYFNDIVTYHVWEKAVDSNKIRAKYSEVKGAESLCEFLSKDNYFVSESYQNTLEPLVYLSKEEQALYFYYYIY